MTSAEEIVIQSDKDVILRKWQKKCHSEGAIGKLLPPLEKGGRGGFNKPGRFENPPKSPFNKGGQGNLNLFRSGISMNNF